MMKMKIVKRLPRNIPCSFKDCKNDAVCLFYNRKLCRMHYIICKSRKRFDKAKEIKNDTM